MILIDKSGIFAQKGLKWYFFFFFSHTFQYLCREFFNVLTAMVTNKCKNIES